MTRTHKKGVSLVIVIMSLMILLVATGLVIDTGIVVNAQAELQKQVETTALYGATVLEPQLLSNEYTISTSTIQNYIKDVFKLSQSMNFVSTLDDIQINTPSKAVAIKAKSVVQTYFLNLAGINVINIEAQAAAMSSPFYLSKDFPTKPTKGSILTFSSAETEIRRPLGLNQNLSIDSSGNMKLDYLYGSPDNKAVSLGSGGYAMIRLPVPLIDDNGADLYIKELGNMEGYFVFTGNDIDPNDPYINEGSQGAGIKWTNISCTGYPEGDNLSTTAVGAYSVPVEQLDGSTTTEAKFYGSGYFDLGAKCSNGYDSNIKAAKYIKIIDDNEEDGFMADNPTIPAALYGEHSSVTPGVDLDTVAVLHHSRLISYSTFSVDSDSDGLIDVLEDILGTDKNNSDTDNDGINDSLEYSGWYIDAGGQAASIIDTANQQINLTSPTEKDIDPITGTIKPLKTLIYK